MQTVTVEILRAGQPHKHELSDNTKYIVLCGSNPPIDLTIPVNQATFNLNRQLLRYNETDEKGRQKGLHFFEKLITGVLEDIESLIVAGQSDGWLHLRLIMTPHELAQLPFELALTPKGIQGYPLKPFLLNPQRLTTLTRETRQVASPRYLWPHKPRILFAWCAPKMEVPHIEHFNALVEVLKELSCPIKDNAEPVPDIAPLITSLKNASLKTINDAVKSALADKKPYTHIHLLAHGGKDRKNVSEAFKLVMHDNKEVNQAYNADGYEIANAILETAYQGTNFPAVVTLMACDSANEGSITLPAGSIAHQLHESGIPAVFASQFPLSTSGSVKLVATLYQEMLNSGEDPRIALYNTRKTLYDSKVHDWASLVAYVRFPEDMEEQLKNNRLSILLEALKTANKWADHVLVHDDLITSKKDAVYRNVSLRLDKAIKDLKELFLKEEKGERTNYAEHFGLLGSAFKRKAEHLFRMADFYKDQTEYLYKSSLESLRESQQWYFKGYDRQKNHWNASQYLSLTAVIDKSLSEQKEKDIWTVARILAEDDTREGKKPIEKIWAWGTLAELYLLLPLALMEGQPGYDQELISARIKASQFLQMLSRARFDFAGDPSIREEDIQFAQESTRRQFERYVSWWPEIIDVHAPCRLYLQNTASELLKNL